MRRLIQRLSHRAPARSRLERMADGGVVLFDDYGWPATFGARAAIDEVCREFGQTIISIPESTQAFVLKR